MSQFHLFQEPINQYTVVIVFRQNKPQDSGNDRYSGDDRSSRNLQKSIDVHVSSRDDSIDLEDQVMINF